MGKAIGLVMALMLLAAPAGAEARDKLISSAEETVLRLHDLPPGYLVGGESGCESVKPTGIAKLHALDSWIAKSRPAACDYEYIGHFEVPGSQPAPPFIDADIIAARSTEDATAGFQTLRRLASRVTRFQPYGSVAIFPDGPTASLFRYQRGEGYESSLLWQYGRKIAAIEVSETSLQSADEAALFYAQAQQRHLESPSPYTEDEQDDTEVELDDPSLRIPVYWLGRDFDAGGLGHSELQTAAVIRRKGLPGERLELRYDGFDLKTWTQPSWKRFQESFFRKINRPRCTRTFAFEGGPGHAVISAGYRRRTFRDGCPDYPPTRYWAVVHIGGVVVGVNETTCRCLSPGFGPYSESLRGMKAIVRGLTLRPKPTYGEAP